MDVKHMPVLFQAGMTSWMWSCKMQLLCLLSWGTNRAPQVSYSQAGCKPFCFAYTTFWDSNFSPSWGRCLYKTLEK